MRSFKEADVPYYHLLSSGMEGALGRKIDKREGEPWSQGCNFVNTIMPQMPANNGHTMAMKRFSLKVSVTCASPASNMVHCMSRGSRLELASIVSGKQSGVVKLSALGWEPWM